MPILTNFALPPSASDLFPASQTENIPFFLTFLASTDPATGKPWCPDVQAALPRLNEVFVAPGARSCGYVEVGQKEQWRDMANVHRKKWGISCVPTLVRYEVVDGEVREVGRLVEGEILDRGRLNGFVFRESARN
ncbi:hypothetical protein BDV06DRAFT_224806 [Aspergillus oleicola]